MSDGAPTQQPTATDGTQASTQAQRGLYSSGLKLEAADGVPSEFVGKDIKEIVQLAQTYKQALASPPPQQYAPPAYQPPPQQAAFLSPPDPQLMYTNPPEYQRQYEAYSENRFNERLNQAAAPLVGNLAQQGKLFSQRDPEYSEVWQKYGHEIDAMARNVPPQMLTLEAWNTFADVVRGKHYREFAGIEAQRIIAAGGAGTERSTAAGAPPVEAADPLTRLMNSDHPWARKARAEGLSESSVRDYCAKRGISPDTYANDILNGNVISAGAR